MSTTYTVIIADDHPLFRAALKGTLASLMSDCDIIEANDINSLQMVVEANPNADLILLDLHMPGAHGFSGLIHLSSHHCEIPVAVISAHETPEIMRRALDHGAAGFLPKSSSATIIGEAINAILAGDIWLPEGIDANLVGSNYDEIALANVLATLTPQQFRVASMLAEGLLNKQIAYEMNVTEATIEAHITEVYKKLKVQSRTQAVLVMSQLDVLPPNNDHCSA